jgi:nicotinamide-nucleotide amidase
MHAEVIAIGDELTSGQRLDTNSQWLAEQLGEIGVRVLYHSTVGDDLAANVRVFREAIERSDIIVASGGLGPTADDLTRQALADTVEVPLVQDDAALSHIRSMFARRKREMPPANLIQAQFPRGSRVVPNPHGTAPGIDLEVPRVGRPPARVFCLPGVPAEMKEMWSASVRPAIASLQPEPRLIRHKRVKCFGVGESDLEAMLPDLIARQREPLVGITVSKATITLRVTASGRTPEECDAAMQPTLDTIHACLGEELIFGSDEDELQHAVVRLLRDRQATLATLECGTGGLIAYWLDEVLGSQQVYAGGEILSGLSVGVGVVNGKFAELVERTRQQMAADYALGVGPFPREPKSPLAAGADPGSVWLVVAAASGTVLKQVPFTGHPDILKARIAKSGLNLLRLSLLGRTLA